MTARQNMTPEEFDAALKSLGLTATQFAQLVGSNEKNMRRAAEPGSDGPGPAASFALRLMMGLQTVDGLLDRVAGAYRDDAVEAVNQSKAIIRKALRGEFE